ncbi:hypothetical protein BJI69_08835 [Luteibacter rhizovicinus DSM 16549]|uniref:Outer membrane protein beta-barrel domain-containing protein n=1 Tax=Luteibacter rhizovicinus DSM 16549 TaxID=1440763 RepID=A0A0G9H9J0_9GAMM|nr:porin family protein [Luteibacter rhizovicinus]APG03989.1 hypothetical protein BJI69_08835 [Luteibacter rhizovicinus DSM 16549]KLD66480.1 hypothetical protein Y883_13610 [Luteibacter rhizovicinus DSM 16549]KLD78961.1 hypothetical protein Y886_07480 [Xanthomonas hyacinthi DSM 19077]
MKRTVFATAVALSLSLVSVAATASSSGAFVRFEGARANYDIDSAQHDGKSARAFGVTAGYRWQLSKPLAFGIEAGYMNLGTVKDQFDGVLYKDNGSRQAVTIRSELGTRSFLFGPTVRWNMSPAWSLTGRLGIAHARTRVVDRIDAGGTSRSHRNTLVRNTAYAGVGVGYAVTSNIDLGLNVTHYSASGRGYSVNEDVNTNVVGASVEVRF